MISDGVRQPRDRGKCRGESQGAVESMAEPCCAPLMSSGWFKQLVCCGKQSGNAGIEVAEPLRVPFRG